MSDQETEIESDDDRIPFSARIPTGTKSVTAQQLFVQDFNEFIQISFFEMITPPFENPTDNPESFKRIKEKGIVLECVSKVNVPRSQFPVFLQAMQSINIDKDISKE